MSTPKVLVIIPTHTQSETLINALESVKNQTYENLEVKIIGDGASQACIQVSNSMCERDSRFTFQNHPKSPRRGEVYRHEVISQSDAEFVTYLTDDDHFLQDHVETLLLEINGVDFINPFPTFIDRNEQVWFRLQNLAHRDDRLWHLSKTPRNSVPLSGVMHSMRAYRSLDEGWSTTPDSFPWTDLYMWRKFFIREDLRLKTSKRSTVHKFLGVSNKYDAEKIEQNNYWFTKTTQPEWSARWNHEIGSLSSEPDFEWDSADKKLEWKKQRPSTAALEKELDEIINSKSWRLTEPLRRLASSMGLR